MERIERDHSVIEIIHSLERGLAFSIGLNRNDFERLC